MLFFKKKSKIDENILKEIYKKFRIRRYFQLIIGVLILAIAFNLFLSQNEIVSGGVGGL